MFVQLSQAVNLLARNATTSCPAIPPPDPPHRTKVCKPDQFDGLDPQKLQVFLVQCELNFQDCPNAFNMGHAKVIYAQSYLKGMALDWFEPELLLGPNPQFRPRWMDDYPEFVQELKSNFGPHDPVGDAEHRLSNLSMKDNQQIAKYIVEFNCYASQVQGYGEGALHHYFYNRLPDRIKDQIANVGKPTHLHSLHLLAQDIDACYWECKAEVSRQTRPSAPNTPTSTLN